jgi:hypothetical protein
MDDSPRLWITPFAPLDAERPEVLLALDRTSTDPGEQTACALLDRGHEGEEGVFYLLAEDLSARYARTRGRLDVTLLTGRDHPVRDLAALEPDPLDPTRAVLLRRSVATDFRPAEDDGEPQPVLLVDHVDPVGSPADLAALFTRGEAGVAVVRAVHHP